MVPQAEPAGGGGGGGGPPLLGPGVDGVEPPECAAASASAAVAAALGDPVGLRAFPCPRASGIGACVQPLTVGEAWRAGPEAAGAQPAHSRAMHRHSQRQRAAGRVRIRIRAQPALIVIRNSPSSESRHARLTEMYERGHDSVTSRRRHSTAQGRDRGVRAADANATLDAYKQLRAAVIDSLTLRRC